MSAILIWMKEVYTKAKEDKFDWKPIYPNNMPCNDVIGVYTDMFFKQEDTYIYLKYSIQYCYPVDEKGFCHPEEAVKYYVLHELRETDVSEIFEIPEPSNDFDWESNATLVNTLGDFCYVFDTEESAKCNVSHRLLGIIYPYIYLLSNEELEEWKDFLVSFGEESKSDEE